MSVIWMIVVFLFAPAVTPGSDDFDTWFSGDTMRVDLYQSGNAETAMWSLDEVIHEGAWPGTRTKLVDTTNLGLYQFRVLDAESGALLYSRGFCSMFGEWQTTDEAKKTNRSIGETMRFPYPRKPIELALYKRDDKNDFAEMFRVAIDPNYHTVRQGLTYADFKVLDLHVPAEPRKVYDVLILPEGYTKSEAEKLRADTERVKDILLKTKPYSEMKDIVAVRAVEAFSRESGIDEPRNGIWRDTLFDASYNSFDSARYVLTPNSKTLHDVAANAPYDALLIMVNSPRYGGGGIFNLYTTFAVDSEWAEYLVTHEAGHSFAGLDDEYYTSDVAYTEFYKPGVEPWSPNVTALLDPANLKWGDMVAEGTPIPTPDTDEYKEVVGAFEGACYVAKGLYRPCFDCKMKSKANIDYCPVCMQGVRRLLEFYTED